MRFTTSIALLAALALLLVPSAATAQFVPPDDGGDGYAPPPPPPPTTTPAATTSSSSSSSSTAKSGDRPLSYSERMKLKEEEERKEREAKKAQEAAAVAGPGGIAGPAKQTRPTDFSIGFGAGWMWSSWTLGMGAANRNPAGGPASSPGPGPGMGTDIFTPNVASARIRFGESLALEPGILLGFGNASENVDIAGGTDADVTNKWGGWATILNLAFRYGFMHRASSSALLIFGADFGATYVNVDPEGSRNNTQALSILMNLNFGLGVEWFITRHLSLSGDMVSSLLRVTNTATNDPNADTAGQLRQTSQGSLDVALNFQPGARLMFHVYY